MHYTKILATLGPASEKVEVIRSLIEAGANGFRLNFSHGTHEAHARFYRTVRQTAKELGTPVAILQDLQGPKIRTGNNKDGQPLRLRNGEKFTITTREILGEGSLVGTTYSRLPRDVKRGDRILLDDGMIELRVERSTGTDVETVVIDGGFLGEHKGINLPGVAVSIPALTEKDKSDAAFGLELGVDYIALSFVRKPDDILELREFITKQGKNTHIVAKIEKPEAVDHLAEILDVTDGVMVARGDLGIETSIERVPVIQKTIIAEANKRGKLVITATQMLESMIHHPIPTRAEVTDIANAVLDGTDVLMLSGETANGDFPVETVKCMARVAEEAELNLYRFYRTREEVTLEEHSSTHAIVAAAAAAARDISANAIVAFSLSGRTASLLSQQRPFAPIIAFASNDEAFNRLALVWGVQSYPMAFHESADELLRIGEQELIARGIVKPGDTVVMVAGTSSAAAATNMLKVHRIVKPSADEKCR
ncbi:MAG: pyruvate kinase [Planctomycetota bacterium]|nr:pyruvate kinase [Planctomycetota bacterium]